MYCCNNNIIAQVQSSIFNGEYIRAINYHNTPEFSVQDLERQLKFFKKYFSPVSVEDLDDFFDTGKWKKEKPGLIISFFNGYRNNYDVYYPLLEKYGFIGWFFIATDFVNTIPEKQKDFAVNHRLVLIKDEYKDGRYALSLDEIKELDKHHVIASHTKTHSMLTLTSSENDMRKEIIESKKYLEGLVSHNIDAFCWLGGEDYNYNPAAAKIVSEAGYRFMFGNIKIERIK